MNRTTTNKSKSSSHAQPRPFFSGVLGIINKLTKSSKDSQGIQSKPDKHKTLQAVAVVDEYEEMNSGSQGNDSYTVDEVSIEDFENFNIKEEISDAKPRT